MDIKTQIKMVLTMNANQLEAVASKYAAEAAVRAGLTCPACDSDKTGDNGYMEFCCEECDHRWGCEGGEWYGFEVAA